MVDFGSECVKTDGVVGMIGTAHYTSLMQCCYTNMMSHKMVMLYASQHFGPTENISFENLNHKHDCQKTTEGL
jgi:hypothetical protein